MKSFHNIVSGITRMNEPIRVGSLVCSICGHDAGRIYMVCDLKEPYAFLCDGVTRDLVRSKKKLVKHCVHIGHIPASQTFLEQIKTLEAGPQRAAIRKTISIYNPRVMDNHQG